MSIMRNLLNVIIILCVYLNLGCTEGAREIESGKVDSHTIQFIPLSPSPSSCIPSSKGFNTKSSLPVVHKHGPCSPLRSGQAVSVDYGDILAQDKARVDSIHSKSSKNLANRPKQSQSIDLPVKDESKERKLGSGNYLVTMGIGTPKQDQSMIIDTGSDLTWTKCGRSNTNSCKSCKSRQCAKSCKSAKNTIFNPLSSSSFDNISSSSPICSVDLESAGIHTNCTAPSCCYSITYADESSSSGFLAKDRFTLSSSGVFDDIHFGCSERNNNISDHTDGLLGLSHHSLSFPSQTATTYNNVFSYCLPSTSSTGHLTFGSAGISESVKYTPIITLPKTYSLLYGIDIVSITVGGTKLEIPTTVFSEANAIIDSGTVITRLPPKAYAALRSEFKKQMTNYKISSKAVDELMDTCYHSTGHAMAIPKISFSFRGGTTVELDSKGILYQVHHGSYVCLAFAGNENGEVAIFGSVQQMTLQVVYDKAGGRVGFAPNGCT